MSNLKSPLSPLYERGERCDARTAPQGKPASPPFTKGGQRTLRSDADRHLQLSPPLIKGGQRATRAGGFGAAAGHG